MSETEILPGPPPCEIHHRLARVDGVRLHYVEAQPATENGKDSPSGKLCLLLHGFPEFWYSWRHQIPFLAQQGFRVLAPDLRGYNESDRPPGVKSYRLRLLMEDVIGLIRHAGAERAVVVGHDWGGVIAWKLAMTHPQWVERLIILNSPHPAAYRRQLHNPMQLLRSWYILFFQLPWLPERLLAWRDYTLLERMLRREPVRAGTFSRRDVQRYKDALSQPGAPTATINYYRALLRYGEALSGIRPILAPTLLVWGEKDRYLGPRLTRGLERCVPNLQVVRLPQASHWVQNDDPEQVNQHMLAFLRLSGSA
jgi:pimeloyl-ACP methyl ester carboxylesterase